MTVTGLKVVGLGGSLREASRSRAALAVALEGAAAAQATVELSGAFKNAIDWLHMLGTREPPYLHDEVIGLISAAGGTQGPQVVNTMEFSVRSLRGWAVPYVVPVPQATRVFADSGGVQDELVEQQLRLLGEEVVRVAERFARDPALHRQGECDDAADRLVTAGLDT
jgi:FMN reductase